MKNILLIVLGVVIGTPMLVAGTSITSSLIAGQTVDEAVNTVALQVESILGRVETVEVKQTVIEATVASTTENVAATALQIEALKEQNSLLEQQNQTLKENVQVIEKKNATVEIELEKTKGDVAAITPPPLPDPVREFSVSKNEYTGRTELPANAKDSRVLSLRLTGGGNVDSTINTLRFEFSGQITAVKELGLHVINPFKSSFDTEAVLVENGVVVVTLNYPVPAGETRDIVVNVNTIAEFGDMVGGTVSVKLTAITSNGSFVGLPIIGDAYTLK